MSDGEVLSPFTRGCKARASLPTGRSSGPTRERSPGVLFLQYGEETKQVRISSEISSRDALRALFVTAYPHQLTMKMLQSPNMAFYIKDTGRNVYYDLDDLRNITSHSCLKVYHKDPAHVFNRHARPANTEGRISKEVLYGSHSPVHTLSSSSRSALHSLQGSMSPPMVRSMPSSPSRMAYCRASAGGGVGAVDPGRATLPRERMSGALCTSSSAILERRDVKPDDDTASNKSMALVVRGEGGPHYSDSHCSSVQDRGGGGGRLSMASSQCSAPPSLPADVLDYGVTGIPGGLQQYRASIKPLMGYAESLEHQTQSLHRQKNRKYGDSQFPSLEIKTPPISPHRVSEVRKSDGQIIGGVGLVSPERMSPIRRSLRRDSNGVTVEVVNRSKGSGSSSSTSSVFMDSPVGQPERLFHGHVSGGDAQSERMKAMEDQIASLAGLVHHALSMGADTPGATGTVREAAGRNVNNTPGASSEPPNPAALIDGYSPAPLALQAPPSDGGLQQSLALAKRNVCELRLQLNQLRHLQLSNQESVSSMLRMAGQELIELMCDRLAQSEEATYRGRAEIEQERIHYQASEERILTQLSELEEYVDRLHKSSTSGTNQLAVTLRDVEEGAVNLRRVGKAVAILKGEFPELQVKMRSVLRLEVEAVRFLKEEPHKMDSMLKRVKALTETLSSLRRCVSASTLPARSAQEEPPKVQESDEGPLKTQSPQCSPKPQPRSSVKPSPPHKPSSSEGQAEVSLDGLASPNMAHRMRSTAATGIQSPHHHSSPPLTPNHGRDSPSVAKVSPRSREGSPAMQKPGALQSDGLSSAGGSSQSAQTAVLERQTDKATRKHTHMHTETATRQTPEGSLSADTSNSSHSNTSQAEHQVSSDSSQPPLHNINIDFDQVLRDAQASLMKSIPELTASDTREVHADSATGQITSGQDTSLDLTVQASEEQKEPRSHSQEDTPPRLNDEVDCAQAKPADTAAPSQFPTASVEPLPSSAAPLAAQSEAPSETPAAAPTATQSTTPSATLSATSSAATSAAVAAASSAAPPSVAPSAAPSVPLTTVPSVAPPTSPFAAPSAAPSTKNSRCPQVEKPHRSSLDREMKQSPERASKSPPPPPPRKFNAVSLGLATGKSSGEILSTRKEPVGAQEEDEKEKVVVPQPKPQRQPPEVKPKPQMRALAPLAASSSTPAVATAHSDREEEEEGDNEYMKEVTMKLSNKNYLPGGNKLWEREARTTPQMAKQNPSQSATSDQLALQMEIPNGSPQKPRTVVRQEKHTKVGKDIMNVSPDEMEASEQRLVKQVPLLNCETVVRVKVQKNEDVLTPTRKKAEKVELPSDTTIQKENGLSVYKPDEIIKEIPRQVCSPTTAEKKVKFTSVVTLQKGNTQATDITSPDPANEKVAKEIPAEKKTNVTVVLTLQKETPVEGSSMDSSPNHQNCASPSPDQEYVAHNSAQNPFPLLPTMTCSNGSEQQNQDAMEQKSKNQLQYTDEGGTLSPDVGNDEGPPPPPPPSGKMSHRISKTRSRSKSKEEDSAKMSGSDIQTVAANSAGEPISLEYENKGFQDSDGSTDHIIDNRPIIVIFDDPMDIQSAYKRLSTIFEYEEDLDGILSPESIVNEEETKQEEQKQSVRQNCILWDSGLEDITRNGQNPPRVQQNRTSADNGSIPENQHQVEPDSPQKPETKRKFKFKFPKNKLAAISQAIRTGATKTGKKTVEIVVYEEEEEAATVKETKKQTNRSEIASTKQGNLGESNACDRDIKASSPIDTRHSKSPSRVEELCKTTFDSIGNLEESIKQLEISVDSMTAPSSPSSPSSPSDAVSSIPRSPDFSSDSTDRAQLKVKVRPLSPSKRPAPQVPKGTNPPQTKKAKPQIPHNTGKTSTKKQTSSSSSSSSSQRSHTKSHHSQSPEKTRKGQQQATQKQPSQADNRSSRAAGGSNHSVVALRASKIPALCHNSGKHLSASVSTPHCSDAANSPQNISSSSSSSSSSSPACSSPASSASSSGKHTLLSSPSNSSKGPSHPSSPSSQRSKQPFSFTSLVKNASVSLSNSPSSFSPSSSPPPHKSFIPSLNLSHLLPSSSHILSPSHANVSPAHRGPRSSSSSRRQHCLVFASTPSATSVSQHSYYSSSSYSSSSSSPSSSSSTSSSLSPTSTSSSPPSPSSFPLPAMGSHGVRSVQTPGSNPNSPGRCKKRTGGQASRVLQRTGAASNDAA